MAHIHRSVAAIRIFGDSLRPDELSRLLGCSPTSSYSKGDVEPSKRRNIVRKTGMWSLEALIREPEDLDGQVVELLGHLPAELAVWEQLSIEYEVDLFCGFFMAATDEGLEISSKTLKALGDRRVKLGLCIYAPIRGENGDEASQETPTK